MHIALELARAFGLVEGSRGWSEVGKQGCKPALHKCGRLRSTLDHRTLVLVLVEDHLNGYRLYNIFLDRTEDCRDPNLI